DSGTYVRERMELPMTAEDVVDALVTGMAGRMEEAVAWRPRARDLREDLRTHGGPTAPVARSPSPSVYPPGRPPATDPLGRGVGGEVSDGKPHPAPYLTAARLLGVEPADCIAIEDSPTGAASADAAGCHVLAIPHHVPVPESPRRSHRDTLDGLDARGLLLATS